jgi:hypothetical protein
VRTRYRKSIGGWRNIESNFYSCFGNNDSESKKFKRKILGDAYKAYFFALVHQLMFMHGTWFSSFNGSKCYKVMDKLRANS